MLESGTLLQSRYRILSQIGKGGMGTVYVARDENIGMSVAVKRNFLEEPRLIEAFKREARLLAGLRHSALPQVKDYFIDGTGQYLVMEYIAGDDLGTILQKRKSLALADEAKPFEVEEVVLWAEQLLDALDYLHTRSEPVIHRDIKPLNLKLAERSQIILLDFGLAKGKPMWMTRVTSTGSLYGYTPNYAPIEQIRGLGTDPRSDLYALGATLYHLITGVPPIDAATRAESFLGAEPDPLLPANRLNPKVPQGISSLLMKAMEPHRNNRPSSAAEMLKMLRTARHSTVIDWQTWQKEEKQRQQTQPAKSAPQTKHLADADRTREIATHTHPDEANEQGQWQKQQEEQARKSGEEADRSRKQWEAERKAKEEAEFRAREEAELRAREEADLRAQEEAELRAREEAELRAREEAELREREEAELRAREEAELREREEAELKAREEAERKAREEAELKTREEAERKTREEAERRRRQQYEDERLKREAEILHLQKELEGGDRKAREEAELKSKQEAERKAREEAELKAKQEAERKAREEAELKARGEAECKAREKAERKAREEADRGRRLKRVAEILRLQKEQEEVDRQEFERLRLQREQEQKPAEEAGGHRSQEKPRKDEAIDESARQKDELRPTAAEHVQLWLQKLKPQTRARPETDGGNQEEETRTRLNKERARRLYALLGVAALVLLVLSISVMVLTSNKLKKSGPQATDGQTAQSALDPGVFETPSRVLKVALSDDGRVLASAGEETTVRLWRPSGSRELLGQTRKCRTVAVSHDGLVVASGTDDGTIRLWRASDGVVLKSWRGHIDNVMSLSFSPDGQTLLSAGADKSLRGLRLWRVSDGGLIASLNTSGNDLIVAVGANHKLVGLSRQDGGVHLFYISGEILIAASDIKATPVNCGEFSNDGEMVALGSTQGDVGLWRVSDGRLIKALGKFNINTTSLTFSGNGQILAAGLADGAIKLWRVSDGKLIKTLVGHAKSVNSLSFSADGRTLASGSDDKTVRVWNVE